MPADGVGYKWPRLFYLAKYPGGFWFRVLGWGLSIEDRRRIPALFSERNGLNGAIRLGPLSVVVLYPVGPWAGPWME